MKQNLHDVKAYLIEELIITAVILGRATGGDYAGLITTIVDSKSSGLYKLKTWMLVSFTIVLMLLTALKKMSLLSSRPLALLKTKCKPLSIFGEADTAKKKRK